MNDILFFYILICLTWLAIFCLFWYFYSTSGNDDNAKMCRDLAGFTPIVPVLLPFVLSLGTMFIIGYILFMWLPQKLKFPEDQNNLFTNPQRNDLVKITKKPEVEPAEPKVKAKDGKKPSFKEAFKRT